MWTLISAFDIYCLLGCYIFHIFLHTVIFCGLNFIFQIRFLSLIIQLWGHLPVVVQIFIYYIDGFIEKWIIGVFLPVNISESTWWPHLFSLPVIAYRLVDGLVSAEELFQIVSLKCLFASRNRNWIITGKCSHWTSFSRSTCGCLYAFSTF